MKKLLIFVMSLAASLTTQAADNSMWAYKCADKSTQTKTIVTWEKEIQKDGGHLFATWSDRYGYHSHIELYFNASMPNDDGLIEETWLFVEADDEGKTNGAGLSMSYVKKTGSFTFRLSNIAVNEKGPEGSNVFSEGVCQLTDQQ